MTSDRPAARGFPPADRLLSDITSRPLDPGYLLAGPGRPPRRRLTGVAILVCLVLTGIAVGAAANQLRSVPSATSGRRVLEAEIEGRTAAADELAAGNAIQRARIDDLQAAALSGDDDELAADVVRLSLASGAVAVTGPGLRVTLDDSPDAGDDLFADEDKTKRVLDVDVQQVVNGLWAGGAEAIAVNGQRLTTLSAIRGAGTAILVDYRPLARPYVIDAIGDPEALEGELTAGVTGSTVSLLRSNYGIQVSVDQDEALELPASSSALLRHARPVSPADHTDRGAGE